MADSLGVSDATGYGVDPYAGQDDGVVFNFAPNDTAITGGPQTDAANNPVTPTATTAVGNTPGGVLSSLTATQWGLLALGAVVGVLIWIKYLKK